jgi:Lrp/AsnC family leucine-responsive transcriptional regulator
MTGEMDFLLHVIVRDIEALSDFTMRRLLRVNGVRDVTSSIVLETVKRSPVIPLEELAPD